MGSDNKCIRRQTKTVTFMPGPVGLQLEPTNNSEQRCAVRVVRFVDGGPRNPGQARKSGEIRPGDFVIRAEAATVIGKTYENIVHVLKMSHAVRKLTFLPAWDSMSHTEIIRCVGELASNDDSIQSSSFDGNSSSDTSDGCDHSGWQLHHNGPLIVPLDGCKRLEQNLSYKVAQSSSFDGNSSSDTSDACDHSGWQLHHNGPLIVPLDGFKRLEQNLSYKVAQHYDEKSLGNNIEEKVARLNNVQPTNDSADDSAEAKVCCDNGKLKPPSRPPRSRFAVESPLHLHETENKKTVLKDEWIHPAINTCDGPAPRESDTPPKTWKLNSLLNGWSMKARNLSSVVDAARGSFVPAVANSNAFSGSISTKPVPALTLNPSIDGVMLRHPIEKLKQQLMESSQYACQRQKKHLKKESSGEVALDLSDKTNQEWQDRMDKLFRENLAIHENFEEKLRLTRSEHVSAEPFFKFHLLH